MHVDKVSSLTNSQIVTVRDIHFQAKKIGWSSFGSSLAVISQTLTDGAKIAIYDSLVEYGLSIGIYI